METAIVCIVLGSFEFPQLSNQTEISYAWYWVLISIITPSGISSITTQADTQISTYIHLYLISYNFPNILSGIYFSTPVFFSHYLPPLNNSPFHFPSYCFSDTYNTTPPSSMVPFFSPDCCSYSNLYTHI